MKEETIKGGPAKVLEKYESDWKRDVELSGDEDHPIVLASDYEVEIPQLVLPEMTDYYYEKGALHFLDNPGLQVLPSKQSVVFYFLNPSFLGAVTDSTNMSLYEFYVQKDKNTANTFFNKKKFKEAEIQQYLGLHILFGIYQFPRLEDYWQTESWFRGGIEICIQKGRFEFLNQNFLLNCGVNQRLQKHIAEIKKKFRKLYQPDQELFLWKFNYEHYSVVYVIDYENKLILDLAIIKQGEDINLMFLLLPFTKKNHVIYVPFSLSYELIVSLAVCKAYIVCYSQDPIIVNASRKCVDKLLLNEGYVCPNQKLVGGADYKDRLDKLSWNEGNLIQFKSPFYLASLGLPVTNSNYIRIEFEEYYEAAIFNSQILYELTRIGFANALLADKITLLQRDRREAWRRCNLQIFDREVATDKLSFGLHLTYAESYHTPIPQSEKEKFKYCPVCMKYGGFTKPYFRCMPCENLLKQKVFLCPYPCFELFHRNPSDFIDCAEKMAELAKLGEDRYFKLGSDTSLQALVVAPVAVPPPKLKRKNNLKQIQQQHVSFNNKVNPNFIEEDENLGEILNSLKKPTLPNASNLQPIFSNAQPERKQNAGHRKDMEAIDARIERDKQQQEQKQQQLLQQQQEQKEIEMRKYIEAKMKKKKTHKNSDDSSDEDDAKASRKRKADKKKVQQAQQESTISPFQQFIQQYKSQTKQEEQEEVYQGE